jgi:hypothetical protein
MKWLIFSWMQNSNVKKKRKKEKKEKKDACRKVGGVQ